MSLVQRPSVLESCKLDNSSLWIIRRLRALPEIRLSFLKCGGCYTRGTPSFRSTERFNTERRGREKEPVDFPAIHSRNQGLVFAFGPSSTGRRIKSALATPGNLSQWKPQCVCPATYRKSGPV